MQTISYSQHILVKTAQGLAVLRDRSRTLSMTERQVLILVDGKRTIKQIQQSLSTPVAETLDRLQAMGLVQTTLPASAHPAIVDTDSLLGDEAVMSDFNSDSGLDTAAGALGRFEAASTHFFRAKAVSAPMLAPEPHINPIAHQAASARGILFGKSFLVNTIDQLLQDDGSKLTRKIALINSEAALYYAFEQTVHALRGRANASMIQDITRRFDEAISRH
jgi:hypothetical protein